MIDTRITTIITCDICFYRTYIELSDARKVESIHTEADGKQFIKCRECGYKELFPLPLPSQVVTFWLQDFSDRHADCGSEEKGERE